MSELPRSPEPINNPHKLQQKLKSIYVALPAKGVARERNMRDSKDHPPTSPRELLEAAINFTFRGMMHGASAELPLMKRQELAQILPKAQITDSNRGLINDEFQLGFVIGIKREAEDPHEQLFDIIGVTKYNQHETGIFSEDITIRRSIEQQLFDMQKGKLEKIREEAREAIKNKEPDVAKVKFALAEELNSYFEACTKESRSLYEAPIT